jgi:hypothetical protein
MTENHNCEANKMERNNNQSSKSVKIFFNKNQFVFLQFENFKFILRTLYDDRVLFTHHCGLTSPEANIEILNSLKMQKADILMGYIENSTFYYSQPTD